MNHNTPTRVNKLLQVIHEQYFEKNADPNWTTFDVPSTENYSKTVEEKLSFYPLTSIETEQFYLGLECQLEEKIIDITTYGFEAKQQEEDPESFQKKVDATKGILKLNLQWIEKQLFKASNHLSGNNINDIQDAHRYSLKNHRPTRIVSFLIQTNILTVDENTITKDKKILSKVYGGSVSTYYKALKASLGDTTYLDSDPNKECIISDIQPLVDSFLSAKEHSGNIQYDEKHKVFPISW